MTLAEFLSEFENVASQPPGTIRGHEALESMKGWDSLAVIEFMSMADEKLGLQLEASRLAACDRVSDLAALCGFTPSAPLPIRSA
jgi:acyl carrier protein